MSMIEKLNMKMNEASSEGNFLRVITKMKRYFEHPVVWDMQFPVVWDMQFPVRGQVIDRELSKIILNKERHTMDYPGTVYFLETCIKCLRSPQMAEVDFEGHLQDPAIFATEVEALISGHVSKSESLGGVKEFIMTESEIIEMVTSIGYKIANKGINSGAFSVSENDFKQAAKAYIAKNLKGSVVP